MEKLEGVSLADLAKRLSAQAPDYDHFHGKLYSFIPPSKSQAVDFLTNFEFNRAVFPNKHPAMLLIADLSKIINVQIKSIPLVKDDKLALHFLMERFGLPEGDYLALVSPFKKNEQESSYSEALESIAFIRSYISLFFGKLLHYNWIVDFDFDLTGNLHLPSPVFRMPLHADFLKILDADLGREIIERLRLQLPEYRIRFQRACDLFDMALNQKDEAYRFSSYWIALEVLVGSTGDGIRAKLAEAYGFGTSKNLVDDLLLFGRIAAVRGDLIHKGVFNKILSYQERLLQLYFWDIVVHQIGLRSRGLARLLVTSGIVEEE